MELTYRITGKQSEERLSPLLSQLSIPNHLKLREITDEELKSDDISLDFVWETFREKNLKEKYLKSLILNRLNNSSIIESKSSFVFLQALLEKKSQENLQVDSTSDSTKALSQSCWIKSFVLRNLKEVNQWIEDYLYKEEKVEKNVIDSKSSIHPSNWWVLKAANGNGGKDVWILTKDTAPQVLSELRQDEEYVIQKYIDSPLLYKQKKFHFRCYASLHRDGFKGYVYPMCFILSAGQDYDPSSPDNTRHITNLSVNKHFEGHPGQVPCDLEKEYPQVFESLSNLWADIVQSSAPFMIHQKHLFGFDFYGIDIIVDTDGNCWLIEANRLPGLESSIQNKEIEDKMYDDMMRSFLQIVLSPFFSTSFLSLSSLELEEILSKHPYHSLPNRWRLVTRENEELKEESIGESKIIFHSSENLTHLNILKWKMFTLKNKKYAMAYPNPL